MRKKPSVLVYLRPWNSDQMLHLVKDVVGSDFIIETASDFTGLAKFYLRKVDEKPPRTMYTAVDSSSLTDTELDEIILRCRLLRSLPVDTAHKLALEAEHAVINVLDTAKPALIVSVIVDTYILDLLARLSQKRGIPFLGLVPSFLKNHFRISVRGEYVYSREVTDVEIDAATTSLSVTDYRPDFLVQTEREMRKRMWRLWLRNLPKPLLFAFLRLRQGEADNLHYWASQIIATRFWSFWPRQFKGISGPALAACGDDGGPPLIYLPLQMSPEATIDYWSSDIRWINYEEFIIELLQRYRGKWRFVVKEHPNLVGYRSRGFYKKLKTEPNCVMVSPNVPSNELVMLCRGVLVCTGTAGFEAALRGKPVLTDSAPYYAAPNTLLPIKALDSELPELKQTFERQRDTVAHVLRGTLPGRFLNDGSWNANIPEHRAWNETMAASLRAYLERQKLR